MQGINWRREPLSTAQHLQNSVEGTFLKWASARRGGRRHPLQRVQASREAAQVLQCLLNLRREGGSRKVTPVTNAPPTSVTHAPDTFQSLPHHSQLNPSMGATQPPSKGWLEVRTTVKKL